MPFKKLGLDPKLVLALTELGYETPTPIQIETIPPFLKGNDILGQAETGTGKTAAFALPIISQIDLSQNHPQALILAPTRELAIQVAEAFHSYAKYLPHFHVLPIYGGQDFGTQLRALKRGTHIIVGTPGRVMDHLRRETLSLKHIRTVVLDEADEMLNMGFLEDVKWILEQTPDKHQTALFSATMPSSIRDIAKKYLHQPVQIKIQSNKTQAPAIEQLFVRVARENKLEALTRFLEIEEFEAAIIFTGTKLASTELSEKLTARGYAVSAINGDMPQKAREQVIRRLKNGTLDIIVATQVAARGLDVDRISYVINFDIPFDVESYVHRIGRTGRAGRAGKALLLITPREERMLRVIERVTKHTLTEIKIPSFGQIKAIRLNTFAEKIKTILTTNQLDEQRTFIKKVIEAEGNWNLLDVTAALLAMIQQKEKSITENTQESLSLPAEKRKKRDKRDNNFRQKRRKYSPKK